MNGYTVSQFLDEHEPMSRRLHNILLRNQDKRMTRFMSEAEAGKVRGMGEKSFKELETIIERRRVG